MRIGKIRITAGFVLLIAALVYIDEGRLLWITGAAALLHELGHHLALRLTGAGVEFVTFSAGGICMTPGVSKKTGYGRETAAVLAGPAASLISAVILCKCFGESRLLLETGALCLILGAFNLLPAQGLDGGQALSLILDSAGCAHTHAILRALTFFVAALIAAGGAVLFWASGWNITPLVAGAYAVISLKTRRK